MYNINYCGCVLYVSINFYNREIQSATGVSLEASVEDTPKG